MRRLRPLFKCLAFALLCAGGPSAADAKSDGSTSAEFLKIDAGARAAALGDTQAAMAEGAEAMHWNPAALGALSAPEVSLAHNKIFEDVANQHAALAYPTKTAGTVGFSYRRLATEDFQGFDAQGTPTNTLKSEASVLGLSWGKNFSAGATAGSGLFGGLTGKILSEKEAGVSASGFAADFGILFRPSVSPSAPHSWLRRTSWGFAVRNLGTGLKFDKDTGSLPTEYAAGMAYSQFIKGDILNVGADLHHVTGESAGASAGVEYWFNGRMALRAGYRSTDTDGAGIRAGAGFRMGKVQLDYAWSASGNDFEPAHRFTLTFRFGRPTVAPGAAADLFTEDVAQGRRHMELKLYDRAILDFNEALKIKPDPEVMKLLQECGEKMRGEEGRQP